MWLEVTYLTFTQTPIKAPLSFIVVKLLSENVSPSEKLSLLCFSLVLYFSKIVFSTK